MQIILEHQQIERKICRLAYQILEQTTLQKNLFIGGIQGNGLILANLLKNIMDQHGGPKVVVFEVRLNKEEPWSEPISLSLDEAKLKNGYIILVDDVINSGKTMQYALLKFLQQATHSIKVLTLVDRQHRRFPIKADFVGLSLSTTLKNRVEIDLSNPQYLAFMS
ncbi:MAG: phosphoribosyltransferase [Bacteroidetes bacterium]|nr:phosphoribosyltransferase [Bacteroidota bacterium]MBM3424354.1 phosphoribosyltransferase [Bacteroidota bacterium]